MKYQAVIFDLDGTLIDSERHWRDVEKSLLQSLGLKVTEAHFHKVNGHSMVEGIRMLIDEFGLPQSVEELVKQKVHASESIYTHKAHLMPGVTELLAAMKNASCRLAIASGSAKDRIKTIVQRFHWQDYFETLVSTDDVNYVGKPDPAVFLHALQELNLAPQDCVIIEDSYNGVAAAKAAGVACVAVPDARWHGHKAKEHDKFALADKVVSTLADPALYEFLELSPIMVNVDEIV